MKACKSFNDTVGTTERRIHLRWKVWARLIGVEKWAEWRASVLRRIGEGASWHLGL